jgi:hypothetical protein
VNPKLITFLNINARYTLYLYVFIYTLFGTKESGKKDGKHGFQYPFSPLDAMKV